jgi:hypothetical protein
MINVEILKKWEGSKRRVEEDIGKFEHLLTHWIEHNKSHEESYLKWIQRAEAAGRSEVAREVQRSMEHSQEMSRCFEKAIGLLKMNYS